MKIRQNPEWHSTDGRDKRFVVCGQMGYCVGKRGEWLGERPRPVVFWYIIDPASKVVSRCPTGHAAVSQHPCGDRTGGVFGEKVW